MIDRDAAVGFDKGHSEVTLTPGTHADILLALNVAEC